MSYASLIKTLPETLNSSIGLAALASLGIHGLLLGVLPLLPLDSKSEENQPQRTVRLIELTPAEQSRLPQVTLPPFATQQSELPPLPPAPPSLSLLPRATQSSALPALPPIPDLKVLPPSSNSVSQNPPVATLPSELPALPPAPDLKLPPSSNSSVSNYPPVTTLPSELPALPPPPSVLPALPPPPSLPLLLPPSGTPPVYKFPTKASSPQVRTSPPMSPLPAPYQISRSSTPRLTPSKLPQPKLNQTYRLRKNPGFPSKLPQLAAAPLPNEFRSYQRSTLQESSNQLNPNPPKNSEIAPKNRQPQPLTTALRPKLPERTKQELLARRDRLREQLSRNSTANRQLQPLTTATRSKLPERTKQELLARRDRLREQLSRNSTGSVSAAAVQRNTQLKPLAAQQSNAMLRLRRRLAENSEIASKNRQLQPLTTATRSKVPESTKQELLARRDQLAEQSASKRTGSTLSAATAQRNLQLNTFEARQSRVQQNYSNVVTKAPIYQTRKTCKQELDGGVAVLGVVVNPEGKIVSGPDTLDKKGATGIEQAAKNYVRKYKFPKTDNATNQQFRLQFKYDTGKCSEANSQSTPESRDTPKPKS